MLIHSVCSGRLSGFDCPQLIFILLTALLRIRTTAVLPLNLADCDWGPSDPLPATTYPSGPCLQPEARGSAAAGPEDRSLETLETTRDTRHTSIMPFPNLPSTRTLQQLGLGTRILRRQLPSPAELPWKPRSVGLRRAMSRRRSGPESQGGLEGLSLSTSVISAFVQS